MNQRLIEGHAKHRVNQLDLANFRAGQVPDFDCWHNRTSASDTRPRSVSRYLFACLAAFFTTTTVPFAPGTAPRIIKRLFSASTRATVKRFTVTRSSPMWPEDRMPLMTRDG